MMGAYHNFTYNWTIYNWFAVGALVGYVARRGESGWIGVTFGAKVGAQ